LESALHTFTKLPKQAYPQYAYAYANLAPEHSPAKDHTITPALMVRCNAMHPCAAWHGKQTGAARFVRKPKRKGWEAEYYVSEQRESGRKRLMLHCNRKGLEPLLPQHILEGSLRLPWLSNNHQGVIRLHGCRQFKTGTAQKRERMKERVCVQQ
jgi:hypothetical protein